MTTAYFALPKWDEALLEFEGCSLKELVPKAMGEDK